MTINEVMILGLGMIIGLIIGLIVGDILNFYKNDRF